MKLTLTQGSTTVDLNTYPCKVRDGYKPETPVGNETSLDETIDCIYKGTDAQIKAFCQSINKLLQFALQTADDRQETTPVYTNYALDNDDTAWRSRVYGGKVILHPQITNDFRQGVWRFTITLVRDPWWEGAETQIPLTNTNGTNNTAGLNVYNCNDGSGSSPNDRVNWFYCGAISGDLETPAILKIGTFPFTRWGDGVMYVGMWNNTLQGSIEAADTEFTYELGTDQADAGSSGGSYHRVSWSGTGYGDVVALTMTGIDMQAFGGRWFRPVIFLKAQPTAGERFWLSWGIYTTVSPVGMLWGDISGEVLCVNSNTWIIELPPLPIPPTSRFDLVVAADTILQVFVRAEASGSHVLDVDFMVLMPQDGYRRYMQGEQPPPGTEMVDDGVAGLCYGSGTGITGVVPYGEPFMLKPWEPQHEFHMAWVQDNNTTWTPGDYVTVKLYYRPRRKAL